MVHFWWVFNMVIINSIYYFSRAGNMDLIFSKCWAPFQSVLGWFPKLLDTSKKLGLGVLGFSKVFVTVTFKHIKGTELYEGCSIGRRIWEGYVA